jgi:hypothetical protein
MESKQIKTGDLLAELRAVPELSCRLFLQRDDQNCRLVTLLADGIAPGGQTAEAVYDYGEFVFISGPISTERFCTWIEEGKGELQRVGFTIPQLREQAERIRLTSYFHTNPIFDLPIPHSRYVLIAADTITKPHSGSAPLICQSCPSFPDLVTAAYFFLYGKMRRPGEELPYQDMVLRIPQNEAWIEGLAFYPNSVTVDVRGSGVEGVRLEIRGDHSFYLEQMLPSEGSYDVSLPDGLPSRFWLCLSKGDQWLDYRNLDLSGRASSFSWNNVEVEAGSPAEQIAGLINRGECDTIEYKGELPANDRDFLKTIAAFASEEGGVLLIGVSDKPVAVIGIAGDINKLTRRITDAIRGNLVPEPVVKVEPCEIENKTVIAIFVKPCPEGPCAVGPDKLVYYVRRNASTYPARLEEVGAMFRKFDRHRDPDGMGF